MTAMDWISWFVFGNLILALVVGAVLAAINLRSILKGDEQ